MTLSITAKGAKVRELQEVLAKGEYYAAEIDGDFGPVTRKAVMSYQRDAKLAVDGVAGSATLSKLGLEDVIVEALPRERRSFRRLLLGNPNYFGQLPSSPFKLVKELATNTSYEEIRCLGYQPRLDRLEAIVEIKGSYGYGGPICADGSVEYVRFYVDWRGDGSWTDEGLASFSAHDVPNHEGLYHAVGVALDPRRRVCSRPRTPRVRAILAWKVAPPANQPGFVPVWGNVVEARVQIAPLWRWSLGSKGPIALKEDGLSPTEIGPLLSSKLALDDGQEPALSLSQLHARYAEGPVAPKRYAYPQLHKLASQSLSSMELAIAEIGELLDVPITEWPGFLDFGDGNTSYEELGCIGYDQRRRALTGVFSVKQSSGYSGGLCESGSREYVAFWLWDPSEAEWIHIGTASTRVHDIDVDGSLSYMAYLPVDFARYRRPCSAGPRLLEIRAILSWSTAPPTNDPNWTPTWGNRVEASIELAPGQLLANDGAQAVLTSVGDMAVCVIDEGDGLANGSGIITSGSAVDAPFGGRVTVCGYLDGAPTSLGGAKPRYRLSVRPFEPSLSEVQNPWQPINTGFSVWVTTAAGGVISQSVVNQQADAEGFFEYLEVRGGSVWREVANDVLGYWHTGGREGLWELRLEARDAGGSSVQTSVVHCPDGSARQTVTLRLDNTAPQATLAIDKVTKLDGTVLEGEDLGCGDFEVGDVLEGPFSATDEHFSRASLTVRIHSGGSAPDTPPQLPVPHSYLGGAPGSGIASGRWSFDTSGLDPCGYQLVLQVWDRAILGSSVHSHHKGSAVVGFCLRAPGA